jgi:TonB family protein
MRFSAKSLYICSVLLFVLPGPTQAQREIANPQAIASAKTIYFEDKSGVAAVGEKALAELRKWGRFQIVPDGKTADLILELSADPNAANDLVFSGGQTGGIDSGGRIAEDPVPQYNKVGPVRYASLTLFDAESGARVWSESQRWGGLLTGFNDVGEHLVQEFEKQTLAAERKSRLKVIRSVVPAFPDAATKQHIAGTVVVRIVVDKEGKVTAAKAVSGPAELFSPSIKAAKQYEFEPPKDAPVTTELEMAYGSLTTECPPGKERHYGEVSYAENLPMKTGHAGELRVVSDINTPLPPYPESASDAEVEGDLELFITVAPSGDVVGARVIHSVDPEIDEAALSTVRTWKFKVTRGEQAGFAIKLLYRMTCYVSPAQ